MGQCSWIQPQEAYGLEAREAARALLINQPVELVLGASARILTVGSSPAYGPVDRPLRASRFIGLGPCFHYSARRYGSHRSIGRTSQSEGGAERVGAMGDTKALYTSPAFMPMPLETTMTMSMGSTCAYAISRRALWISRAIESPTFTATRGEFPAVIIPPGHTAKIHSGTGTHRLDPADQLSIYLRNSDYPIWNNHRDRATIMIALERWSTRSETRNTISLRQSGAFQVTAST